MKGSHGGKRKGAGRKRAVKWSLPSCSKCSRPYRAMGMCVKCYMKRRRLVAQHAEVRA